MGHEHWDEHKRSRRSLRNLLIYPKFQIPLIALNLSAIGISLLIFWVSSQRTLSSLEPAANLSGVEVEFFRKVLQYQARQMHIMFAVSGFFTMLFSGLASLILSHKIAGPMVALRHYFRKIKEGVQPMPHLKFRDFDFLQDIPPLINDAMEAMSHRQPTVRSVGGGARKR